MTNAPKDHGVRVLTAYGMLRVGQIIFPNGVERQNLLRSNRVELVKPPEEESRALDRVTRAKPK
jgi:hypothetical protein